MLSSKEFEKNMPVIRLFCVMLNLSNAILFFFLGIFREAYILIMMDDGNFSNAVWLVSTPHDQDGKPTI